MSKQRIILCIDLATTTGFAALDIADLERQKDLGPEHHVASGSWKNEKGDHPGTRARKFMSQLRSLGRCYEGEVVGVFYEKPPVPIPAKKKGAPGRPVIQYDTICVLFGQKFAVEMYAASIGVPCAGITNSTLKKASTGNGRAPKIDVLKANAKRFGLDTIGMDDNEGDALGVGVAAAGLYDLDSLRCGELVKL